MGKIKNTFTAIIKSKGRLGVPQKIREAQKIIEGDAVRVKVDKI